LPRQINSEERNPKATGASDATIGWGTLILGLAISVILLYKNGGWELFRARQGMAWDEYQLFNIMMLILPPSLFIFYVARRDHTDFGFQPGELKAGSLFAVIGAILFSPFVTIYGRFPRTQAYYLNWLSDSGAIRGLSFSHGTYLGGVLDTGRLLYHEAVMGLYMLSWEWFFRGFLLFGLKKIMPTWAAAIVQMIPFFILHLGKPAAEFWSSMLGGLILAPVAIRFKSFLPCFLIHYLISIANDVAVLYWHFR
jgi:membrane protease YdiL (CAAX protease family)